MTSKTFKQRRSPANMLAAIAAIILLAGVIDVLADDLFEKTYSGQFAEQVKSLPERPHDQGNTRVDQKVENKEGKAGLIKGEAVVVRSYDYNKEVREKVAEKGVLGILSGKVKSKKVASADIFKNDKLTSKVDAILQNLGDLKTSGSTTVQRKSAPGIGFSDQFDSELVGNADEVEELVGKQMDNEVKFMSMRIHGPLNLASYGDAAITSERKKTNTLLGIIRNLPAIRYTYRRRVKENSDTHGRITVKFAIDEMGKVIFCSVVNSTLNDSTLERRIVKRIRQWEFDKIDKAGDVSEVVYTFVFS